MSTHDAHSGFRDGSPPPYSSRPSEVDILKLGFGIQGNAFRKNTVRFVRQEQFRSFFAGNTHMQLLAIPGLISTFITVYPAIGLPQIYWFIFTALEFVVQAGLIFLFGTEAKRRKYKRRHIYAVYFVMTLWISIAVGTMPILTDQAIHGDIQKICLYFTFLVWMFFVTWWCAIFPAMGLTGLTTMVALYLTMSENSGVVGTIEWTAVSIYILYSVFFWRQWRVFVDGALLRDELQRSWDYISLALAEFENSAEDWLFETDKAGRLTSIPDRMQMAAEPHELIENETLLNELFVKGTSAAYQLENTLQIQQPIKDVVVQLKQPAQNRFWKLRGRPYFDEDEHFKGYRFVAHDFSESHALQVSAAERERHDAIVRMTAIIAHDFNNYLATVVGSLDVLEFRENLSAAGEKALNNARNGAMRAAKVTHDLLSFTKDHKLQNAKQVNCLNAVQEVSREIISAHGQGLNFQIDIDDELHVLVDVVTFHRALRNLMENAAKAMLSSGHVDVTATLVAEARVELRIRDYGAGIPEAILDRIFEPFFTTRHGQGGTGLGLAMVRGFAHKSDGEIQLQNANPGAEAILTLPLAIPMTQPDQNTSDETISPKLNVNYTGRKALVIEDNPELLQTLNEMLTDLGFDVTNAESIAELQYRVDPEDQLDLIVSDAVLSDGYAFQPVEDLRRACKTSPGVVYVSGFSKVKPPLGTDVLLKPFSLKDLSERIHAVLSYQPHHFAAQDVKYYQADKS